MPHDKVKLQVKKANGWLEIDEFISYSLDSDLFEAADAFDIVVGGYDPGIKKGDIIKVFINDRLELTAIANKPGREHGGENGTRTTLKGVDKMGLLFKHHLETEQKFENISTEGIVEALIKDVTFVNLKDFKIQSRARTRFETFVGPRQQTNEWATRAKSTKDVFTTKPGETVGAALMRFALSKGVLFFNDPDGTFVLGGLITTGTPSFWLTPSNIKTMQEKEDSGQSFSKVVLLSKPQITARQSFDPILVQDDIFNRAEVIDPDFPSGWNLPFVAMSNEGGTEADLQQQATLKMAELKYAEFGLTYITDGHSQGGQKGPRNWHPNTIVGVDDPVYPDLNGDYLIAGRRFTMSNEEGTLTELRLTKLKYSPTV